MPSQAQQFLVKNGSASVIKSYWGQFDQDGKNFVALRGQDLAPNASSKAMSITHIEGDTSGWTVTFVDNNNTLWGTNFSMSGGFTNEQSALYTLLVQPASSGSGYTVLVTNDKDNSKGTLDVDQRG